MLTKMLFGSYKLHRKYVVAFAKLAKYGGIRAVLRAFVWGGCDVFCVAMACVGWQTSSSLPYIVCPNGRYLGKKCLLCML